MNTILLCAIILAQLLPSNVPVPETNWQFWAVIGYLSLQSLGQFWQYRQSSALKLQSNEIKTGTDLIKMQTNGLAKAAAQHAGDAGYAMGELSGQLKEQARVAAAEILVEQVAAAKLALAGDVAAGKLALADQVAAHLAHIKAYGVAETKR